MTARDRLMLVGMVALLALLGAWFLAVAPERERASKVSAEVETARQQLATAETQADDASNARARYSSAYASLVSLGQAVPAEPETPALIYMLDRASHRRDVQFSSIVNGTTSSGGTSTTSTAATPATANTSAGFAQQPFTFVFEGSFVDLYKLLDQLEGFTVQTTAGTLNVKGRLLTIDGVSLVPGGEGQNSSGASKPGSRQLSGSITATAYVLPTGQSALAGATSAGPGGTSAAASATSSPPSGSATSPAAAVVEVTR